MNIKEEILKYISGEIVLFEEPMKKHVSFKVGGPAEVFVSPRCEEELEKVISFCDDNKVEYFILGKGSNLLVSDEGVRGVVIDMTMALNNVTAFGRRIKAGSGASLKRVYLVAEENNLSGFEFASGIPGTIGGALYMNAGAYGGEISDVIVEAEVLTGNGEKKLLSKEELELGYRTSIIEKNNYIVLNVTIELSRGDSEKIKAVSKDLNGRRKKKQPLEYPSAGSTFKRPKGYFAGQLIEEAGLRGFSVGGAEVSEKHCGFVINKGGATALDVFELIRKVIDMVYEKSGVRLEPEVKMLGFRKEEKI